MQIFKSGYGPVMFLTSSIFHLLLHRSKAFRTTIPQRLRSTSSFSRHASSESGNNQSSQPLSPSDLDCSTCSANLSSFAAKQESRFHNSVKAYKRHAIVCGYIDNQSWPRAIEDESFIAGSIAKATEELKVKAFPVKVTVCTKENAAAGYTDVIVYPENVTFRITTDQVNDFAKLLVTPQDISKLGSPQFSCKSNEFSKLVLVCIHGNRDKRCFQHGTEVLEEFRQVLNRNGITDSQINVHGSSHIGGHEFAGTLICYPRGDWYGKLSKALIPELVKHISEDTVLEDCFRGNGQCQHVDW